MDQGQEKEGLCVPREGRKTVRGCRVRRGTRGVRRVLGRERRGREEPR